MSHKTQYLLLASCGVLAAGLAAVVVASYLGVPLALSSRGGGLDELRYVPTDAAVIAYANIREVMRSDLRQRLRGLELDTTVHNEFEQATGVDIEKDLETVVVAMMPEPESPTAREPGYSVLVLARGRLEEARIEALAIEHGGQVETYQGTRLLTGVSQRTGSSKLTVGLIDSDLIGMASDRVIKRAIDAHAGDNIVSNADLMKRIAELDDSHAWAVGRLEALARAARLPSELRQQVPAIQWFSAAGRVNGGLSGMVRAETRNEEAAQNLRDVLRGFLALAKLQAGAKPEMKPMIEALQLSGEGKTVTLAFTVPSELFNGRHAPGMGRRGQSDTQPK